MAIPTQLALTQELDTRMQSNASLQFADAQRQNIAGRDEEAALILAAKSGDGQAFEILIERYQRRILAVARRFTRIREDAEDIAQQSFQKAFVYLHKFEEVDAGNTNSNRAARTWRVIHKRSSSRHGPHGLSSEGPRLPWPEEIAPDIEAQVHPDVRERDVR